MPGDRGRAAIKVDVLPPQRQHFASSTPRIDQHLDQPGRERVLRASGEVEEAADLLGRPPAPKLLDQRRGSGQHRRIPHAQARRANNNAAWREGRSALDANKRRRNACIDELDAAKSAVIQAKAELTRLRQAERWRETMARAEEMGTATPGELLEEQRQIPGRLAQATRDLDIEQVQALRRRLAELPEEIYAARVLEVGRAIEQLRARVIAERAAATALAPDLEQAEERVRLATEARGRIAAQVHWHLENAHNAAHDARARERELGDLAARASEGRPRAGAVA